MNAPRRRLDPTTVLVASVAVALIASYAFVVYLSRELYMESAPGASTFSAAPEGLKTAYRYLDELGAEVGRLQDLDDLPERATLVLAASGSLEREPTGPEAERVGVWVRRGGRLVLAGPDARPMLAGLGLGGGRATGDDVALRPGLPGVYSRGIAEIRTGEGRLLAEDAGWVATFKDLGGQVLLSRAEGSGEVVWLADTYPLSNEGIGERDNGTLAVRVLASGEGPVLFDEYHHGYVKGGGAWDGIGAGGRTVVVLLLLSAAVLVVSKAQRLGPPVDVPEMPAARTLAHIDSLAELYRKAGARGHALGSLEEGLVRALVRRHGTAHAGLARDPSAAAAVERSRALRERGDISVQEFVGAASALRRSRCEVEGLG